MVPGEPILGRTSASVSLSNMEVTPEPAVPCAPQRLHPAFRRGAPALPKPGKKRLKDNARAARHAGGGDERTLLGLLSAVDRRVVKVRQRADADADAARDAAQQARHEARELFTSGGGAADAPDVQALADAASQLHQVCCLECAVHAVRAMAASVCDMMPVMRRRRSKGHSCHAM